MVLKLDSNLLKKKEKEVVLKEKNCGSGPKQI